MKINGCHINHYLHSWKLQQVSQKDWKHFNFLSVEKCITEILKMRQEIRCSLGIVGQNYFFFLKDAYFCLSNWKSCDYLKIGYFLNWDHASNQNMCIQIEVFVILRRCLSQSSCDYLTFSGTDIPVWAHQKNYLFKQ